MCRKNLADLAHLSPWHTWKENPRDLYLWRYSGGGGREYIVHLSSLLAVQLSAGSSTRRAVPLPWITLADPEPGKKEGLCYQMLSLGRDQFLLPSPYPVHIMPGQDLVPFLAFEILAGLITHFTFPLKVTGPSLCCTSQSEIAQVAVPGLSLSVPADTRNALWRVLWELMGSQNECIKMNGCNVLNLQFTLSITRKIWRASVCPDLCLLLSSLNTKAW